MIPSGIRPPVVVGIDDTDADGDAVDRAAAQHEQHTHRHGLVRPRVPVEPLCTRSGRRPR